MWKLIPLRHKPKFIHGAGSEWINIKYGQEHEWKTNVSLKISEWDNKKRKNGLGFINTVKER